MRSELGFRIALCLLGPLLNAEAGDAPDSTPGGGSLLHRALSGPMKGVHDIVFCTRPGYDDPHWYANIGYFCDDERKKAYPGNGKAGASALYKLNVRRAEVTTLLDARGGSIRDPQVHYDAEKVLFSYRRAGSDYYHLYEINLDGSGLRQITSGEFDDYEPTYLPDGDIIFVSTRCKRWVNCWKTQVGILYRCDGDGDQIRPVSANTEHDNTPWVLPDGRILYTRWEYVDRSQVEFHHLWVMNPDGTGQMVYFGNMHPGIVMIDAKPIPGTQEVLASFSPGHGVNEHAGIATVLSAEKGPDVPSAARRLHRGPLIRDPYPLSKDCLLVARGSQILLMNGEGQTQVLYTHGAPGGVHEPRPVRKRAREPIIPTRGDAGQSKGTMFVTDIYNGRNLEGVRRADIKKLLVLESLPKPVNFSGGPDLVSWLGTFTLERVLGTVPVEEDGSAHFDLPAQRQVFFVALDENDLAVKRMQSFTCVMPGEVVGCVGCHEQRTRTPENRQTGIPMALQRPPSAIQPFSGFPDVLDFHRDIQPILDEHCVRCHTYEKREGRVVLAGDLGPQWSHSYFSLFAHRQVADGRNGLGNQPPRTIGSSASPLLQKVDGSHHEVRLSRRQWRTLWLWIETGAPYAGTYAALRNQKAQVRAATAMARVLRGSADVLRRRCQSCHDVGGASPESRLPLPFNAEVRRRNRHKLPRPTAIHERIVFENDPLARFSVHVLLNFTRPHLSPLLLGPLAEEDGGYGSCGDVFKDRSDPDYGRLLSVLQAARSQLVMEPRFATPGFRPNPQYVRELKKYGILPETFDLARQEIDVYQSDQEYWKSLWYRSDRKREP